MAKEKSGYNINFSFTPAAGTAIPFCGKSKQVPGVSGQDKIDMNTDCADEIMEFEPSDQYEITDAKVTVIYDMDLMETLRGAMYKKGTLTISSKYTTKTTTLDNMWINNVEPGDVDLNGNPTMDVTFVSGGGANGEPVVST